MPNMDFERRETIRVTCAPGITPYLAQELKALGYETEAVEKTFVEFSGTLRDAMRLNLHLRTGFHVLYSLGEFRCTGPQDLYDGVAAITWEEIIPPEEYVCVTSSVSHPSISDWTYANLKVKDAIVDRMQAKVGKRPDSGPERDRVVVAVYWHGEECRLFLNTTGNKLADRGYRKRPHKAPMQETLAAAVLMAAGYDGTVPLVNPMCGSGTIAIEAALMATGRAPGLLRSNFGLLHVMGFDDGVWQAVRREAAKARRKESPPPIIATDIDPKAVEAAKSNAKTAGVDSLIEFGVCDFMETTMPAPPGIVLLNPEYGERLGEVAQLEGTYKRIGDFLKQRCRGYTGYVFTGNRELAKKIHLTASRRMEFWNAKIECRLLKYEMYEGSRRKPQ
jgi:putative N6-adenine-specific DNA methylase